MGSLADRLDRRLGGADEAHDLAVLELGVVAQQPENGIRAVLTPGYRGVARPFLALRLRQPHLRIGELETVAVVLLRLFDFLARQLPGLNGIKALDALGRIAVG